MLATDNSKIAALPLANPDDTTIGALLGALADRPGARLVFFYGGRPVKPGYHVTEVKAGQFSALDCGANAEAWSEIFVQLWDVDEDARTHMPAGKFAAIIGKVSDHVPLDPTARLTFEVSDGVAPMQLYCAAYPSDVGDEIHVALSPRPASCKPRDRWLAEKTKADACCAPSAATGKCCG